MESESINVTEFHDQSQIELNTKFPEKDFVTRVDKDEELLYGVIPKKDQLQFSTMVP